MQDFRMATFLAVCEHGSFTRAAEALHVTQPTVTQHVQYLERAYGVTLFDRTGRAATLTRAGRLLRDAALTMSHDEELLARRMRHEHASRRLSFGATLSAAEFMVGPDLAMTMMDMGYGRVSMQVANTRELLGRLDAGEIDFAVVEGDFSHERYASIPYRVEKIVALAAPSVAREVEGRRVADLVDLPLVCREEGSGTRAIMDRELAQRGLAASDFSCLVELGSLGAIRELVARGVGVTFAYESVGAADIDRGALAEVRLADFEVSHPIMFVYRRGSIFTSELEDLARRLKRGR